MSDLSVATWGELALRILAMPKEQQQQPIQCCPPTVSDENPVEMLPGIALGTVEQFEFVGVRSTHDNKYHAGDVVLLLDQNSFGVDGVLAWELEASDDSSQGKPIYGSEGPTKREDQMASVRIVAAPPGLIEAGQKVTREAAKAHREANL